MLRAPGMRPLTPQTPKKLTLNRFSKVSNRFQENAGTLLGREISKTRTVASTDKSCLGCLVTKQNLRKAGIGPSFNRSAHRGGGGGAGVSKSPQSSGKERPSWLLESAISRLYCAPVGAHVWTWHKTTRKPSTIHL